MTDPRKPAIASRDDKPVVREPVRQPAPPRVTRPITTAPAAPFPGRLTR